MRLLPWLLVSIVLASAGCSRTASWAANVGVDDDRIESHVYDAGASLALDVHRPDRTGAGTAAAAPVIVYFHGGRWRDGDRHSARFVGQRLAAAGALVVVPDFRQAPAHAFPAFMADAAQAVAWAHAHAAGLGGDPARIYVMGHSSGAHIAALLGTDARYLAAAGLAPDRLAGVIGWSGPYDFLPIREIDLVDVFGTGEQWPATQPVNFVDGDEPPFLLVHGLDDDVVESRNSVELAGKLRANGVDARLLLLPGGTHSTPLAGFYDPTRAPCVVPAVVAFVRGQPPPNDDACD